MMGAEEQNVSICFTTLPAYAGRLRTLNEIALPTRTNGTTGIAATVTRVSEDAGHALQTTTTTDANGAVTVRNKALNPDGSLASETISVTSADGLSRTLSQDVDGEGVIDLVQTETTVVNGDGSKTTTLTDKTGGGVNLDKIVTRANRAIY